MSYIDALSLAGGNWNTYMADNSETELGYTLYVDGNSIPDYYYSDAPYDTTLSSTYSSGFGVAGSPHTLSDPQADLITYYLSATSDIDFRVSFSDVSTLTFHQNNSPDATGEIFISVGNISDGDTMGETYAPIANYSTWAGDVILSNHNTPGTLSGLTASTVMSQLGTSQIGAYSILHELGHAVGLIHTSDAGYTDTIYNSQKYSIMTDMPVSNHDPDMDSSVHPTNLQLFDIAVLQSMYGVNWGGANGEGGAIENTLYSKDNAFTTSNTHGAFIYTIWDGAGTDVIDATGYGGAEIDLRQGHFSSIGVQGDPGDTPVVFDTAASGGTPEYDAGNVAIAYFAVIENAIGTGGDDTLIGNAWNNVLSGGGGNDTIYGDGATYDGDAGPHAENTNADSSSTVYDWGPDAIPYATNLSGDDILIGGAGNDIFYGGLGNDVIHGGYVASDITSVVSGWDPAGEFTGTNNDLATVLPNLSYASDGLDSVDYSQLPEGTSLYTGIDVTFSEGTGVDLASVEKGYSDEYGIDALFSIESIRGTQWNDTFEGTSYSASVSASKGDDTYSFSADVGGGAIYYYPLLDALSGHITVTVNSIGGTVEKLIPGDSVGEDTVGTGSWVYVGTSQDDTFAGMLPGSSVEYSGGAGNDTYTFNMNDLDAGPTTANAFVFEDVLGSLSNVTVQNYDSESFFSFDYNDVTFVSTIVTDYYKWNAALSVNDTLSVQFLQGAAETIQITTIGATTFEFGTGNNDLFTAATGDHAFYGASGTDTIDYSAATGGVTANLSTGTVSSNGWGYSDSLNNISIIGSSHHNDSITGDGTTTTVSYADATSGVTVNLSAGTATGDGSDTLSAVSNVLGSSHDDTITSSSADNVIDGGAGTNTASYAAASSGVTVDLQAGTATGDGTDTLINIQNVIGSSHNDTFFGATGVDNVIDGGAGTNTINYSNDIAGVTVDLSAGTATDGSAGTDTLSNIQNVVGSAYDDVIVSSSDDNVINGGTGSNTVSYEAAASGVTVDLHGGTATGDGSDTLTNIQNVTGSSHDDIIISNSSDNIVDGGGGNDTVSYLYASSAVTVDLSAGTATGDGNDTLINIHNVIGSSHNDVITGDGNDNIIAGGAGNDSIDGGGGTNTIDYNYDPAGVTVDLSMGTATDGWSGSDTFSNIQNVIGSAHADTLTGDSNDNIIAGGAGNDVIDGGGGTNTVDYSHDIAGVTVDLSMGTATDGWSGSDTLSNIQNVIGSAYDDTITGDSNNNIIAGGAGDDLIDGGSGTNTVDYSHDVAGVTVYLDFFGTGSVGFDGYGGFDTLVNIQNVIGSAYVDNITGDANDNVIVGGAGDDVLDGDGGTNTVDYSHDPAGVTVNLYDNVATDGWGGTDTLYNFQNVIGSAFNDTIAGDANNNVLDGGGGVNTADYSYGLYGVTVDLSMGTATDGFGGSDTLFNFQNVIGSSNDDTITGDSNDNVIVGGLGDDIIDAGGGTNTIDYSNDPGAVSVYLAYGYAYDGWSTLDTLSNIQNVIGSAYNDTLTGDSNDNKFIGGAGDDVIDGGGGTNTVDYSHDIAGVTVDLSYGTATDGWGGSDTLSNIQNVIGSAFDDTITASLYDDNVIDGGGGINTVSFYYAPSGVTVDLHDGTATGTGNDTLINIQNVIGSDYDDTFISDSGNHVFDGGFAGYDTVSYAYANSGVTVDLDAGTKTGDGNDTLINIENVTGSAHNDVFFGIPGIDNILDGGGGINTVDYSHDVAGVTVDLSMGTATDGAAGTDTLVNIQNVVGSAYDDTITGDSNDNVIVGGSGNDIIDGGGGTNTIDYSHDPAGVTVDLSMGTATDGWTGSDTLSNIQIVIGSHYDDSITGDGTSTVSYETASSGVTVDLSMGTATGDGSDTLSGIANVTGSAYSDLITGDSNDNVLYGNGGNDSLTGNAGADTFLFKGATALTGVTTIADFNTTDGDKIDIADVLQGHYDPLTDAITNFVSLV